MVMVLAFLVGCASAPKITNLTYPHAPKKTATFVQKGLTPFELWLLTYTPPDVGVFLTQKDVDKCIAELKKSVSMDVKAAAVWQLNYYQNWNADQFNKMCSSMAYLDESTEWDVMSLMETMFTDMFNAPTAEAYCKGWITLMNGMKDKDDAGSAADDACYFAHPVLMDHALSRFNGNVDPDYSVNGIGPYFGYYYFDGLVSGTYVDEDPAKTLKTRWSQWWKNAANKKKWLNENCDYVSAPRKYMKNGDIYAYIFTVSNYPDKWGPIDLPGTAKDSDNMERLFRSMPRIKSVKTYKNEAASYANFMSAWNELSAFDSNEICFVYFSGHGATDDKGTIWYILLHDFDIDFTKGEFINTPMGSQLQDLMYGAKYMHNNKLVFFITDSCLAGGLAKSKTLSDKKVKSFRPSVWGEQPLIPDVYYDMSYKNLGNFILSCRENQYSYDTPDGGAFTKRYSDIWLNKKFKLSFDFMLKSTSKKLLQDGFGMTPVMCCPKGNEKLTIYK